MWIRICPYRAILLSIIIALATADFINGAQSSSNLDIHLKLLNAGSSRNTTVASFTICVKLLEVKELSPDNDYLLTLTDCMGNTIREDKSILKNHKKVCFNSQNDYSEFNLEKHVDVVMYKKEQVENKGTQIYPILSDNIMFLVPKIDVINGGLALVQWNSPDSQQLFSVEEDTDGLFTTICKKQICQSIIENSNRQKYMNVVIRSENNIHIQQTAEIEIDMEKEYVISQGSVEIHSIRQSINVTDGHPFLAIEMEAPGFLSQNETVIVSIDYLGNQQTNEVPGGWDGSMKTITIINGVLPTELENISIIILIPDLADYTKFEFSTKAIDTSIAIIGSESIDSNAYLRVKVGSDEEDVSVGDDKCKAGDTCYYPYTGQTIKERSRTIEVDGTNINQYDDSTMPFINLNEVSEINLLDEKILNIATNKIALSNSIAVLLFDPNNKDIIEELDCSLDIKNSISCNLENDFNMTNIEQLNMVVMMLDPNGNVLESTLVVLDDLKIKVEMFTLSSLKVTWKGSSDGQYLLDIEPTPNSYKSLSTNCESQLENCLAFFTDVNETSKYTLSVKQKGSKTKVSQTIKTTNNIPDQPEQVIMSKVIKSHGSTKMEIDPSMKSQVNSIEVSVTRLDEEKMAKQTIMEAQQVGDGNIYSSNFPINPEDESAISDVTELILIGYDENYNIIATSYLSYHYTDILVKLTSVGSHSDSEGWSLRVVPLSEDLNITDSICTVGGTCYIIEPETPEICVDVVGDEDSHFKQCDETQEPEDFRANEDISEVILRDEQEVVITSKEDPAVINSEIYIYYADEVNSKMDVHNCSDLTSCSITIDIPEEEYLLKILIVTLNEEDMVLKSSLISFEDLKMNVIELTSDILETTWHHGVNTDNYLVHLSTKTKSFISDDLKSTCSNNATCTAVFSHVTADDYIFTVQKEGDDLSKVVKTVTVTGNGEDDPEKMTVSNLIESNGCTKITVEKKNLLTSSMELEVSITSKDNSGTPNQTYVPGIIISEDNDTIVYSIPIEFHSSIMKQESDETQMVLLVLDEHTKIIASAELNFHYKELSSKINPVGAALDDDQHSVRVVLEEDEFLQNKTIKCSDENPCYFIEPQKSIPVCREEEKGDGVKFCNDASSEFEEIISMVTVVISEDGVVQVSTKLSNKDLTLEVVVYEDKNPHNILSKDGNYNCVNKKIDDNTYSCSQQTKVTKDFKSVCVLIVIISSDKSVLQSIKKIIPINDNDPSTEVWVIVVSSVGAIFGVIFIIFAILVTWKKMSTKKEEENLTSQDHDTRKERNINVHNADEDQYEDDLHMGQQRSQELFTHDAAYNNTGFAHNRNIQNSYAEPYTQGNIARSNAIITQHHVQNRFIGNYAPRNNANITNNVVENSYAEPYTSSDGSRGMPRSAGLPRTNQQNHHARPRNPQPRNDQLRRSNNIPAGNAYNRPFQPSQPSAFKPPMRANDPIYGRLSRDNATSRAVERLPLGPIPRIAMQQNRIQQYIPPHGNWDVDI